MRFALAFLILFWVGCATTRIISEDPKANILMDGNSMGTGLAEISSIGPPHTATLEAKKNGHTIGTTSMKRSFGIRTLLWGVVSYYTGWYWGWYYPDLIVIPSQYPVAPISNANFEDYSPWSHPRQSIWMQPFKN